MTNDKQIPNYVFEDLLFRRRLERTLNKELERFNALLKEQMFLIDQRNDLLRDLRCAALQRLADEETFPPTPAPDPTSMEAPDA